MAFTQDHTFLVFVIKGIAVLEGRSIAGKQDQSDWCILQMASEGATHSLIQMNKADATLPALSVASYPCLMSSVKARAPTPAVPVAVAAQRVAFALPFRGLRLWPPAEEPEPESEPEEYGLWYERGAGLDRGSSWLRQLEQVHRALLGVAKRLSTLIVEGGALIFAREAKSAVEALQ